MNYQTENVNELFTALAKAQGKMTSATKESKGYNYKYADLASVWDACREPLSQNGLSVTHIESQNEHGDILITILNHSSGQWIRSITPIRVKPSGKMNELQERGSVLTYLKRYALASIVGIAPANEDDDGKNGTSYQSQPTKQNKISAEQAVALRKILIKCSEDYQNYISDYLAQGNLKTLADLPIDVYDSIYKTSVAESNNYQAHLLSKSEVASAN